MMKTMGMVVLSAMMAFAADVAGKYSAETETPRGPMKQTFEFKVEGKKLTGTVGGGRGNAEISDGKVDGDKVSFKVVREFNGNSMTMNYKGKVSGDELKLTMEMEGGQMPAREITAKREK